MRRCCFAILCVLFILVAAVGADRQQAAAEAVARAFNNMRGSAHLPPLEQMGRNTFGGKVCAHDLRMPSGNIDLVRYDTSDPASLPDAAQKLALKPDDGYRKALRFGIGVCALPSGPNGSPQFSVLIATYESRWMSFVRIFFE